MHDGGYTIVNGHWSVDALLSYRKRRDKHFVSTKGRWGPGWLHRLVWRVARNLGMIGHPAELHREETARFHKIPHGDRKLLDTIHAAFMQATGAELDPVEVVVGPDCFTDMVAAADAQRRMQFIAPAEMSVGRGKMIYTLHGIPIRLVPNVSGFVVLPIDHWPVGVELRSRKRS